MAEAAKKSTAAKVASPKAKAEEPKVPAPDTETSNVDVTSAESQEPAEEAGPGELGSGDIDEGESEDSDLTNASEPEELVNVQEPCPKCYPEGWFEHEEGVTAACSHLRVVYGTPVVITAKLAKELGFKPMGKGEGK